MTAGMYLWDKRAAIKDKPRVAEKTLLVWSLLGGWPGALIAGKKIRHKTIKGSYRIKFVAASLLNIAVVSLVLWFRYG